MSYLFNLNLKHSEYHPDISKSLNGGKIKKTTLTPQ